jgi:hypothetical protein
VHVGFGPLSGLAATEPVTAVDWTPGAFADAAETLLLDPSLAAAQVAACRSHGRQFTWEKSASALTAVYRQVLSHAPARGQEDLCSGEPGH